MGGTADDEEEDDEWFPKVQAGSSASLRSAAPTADRPWRSGAARRPAAAVPPPTSASGRVAAELLAAATSPKVEKIVAAAEADKAEGTRLFHQGRPWDAYKVWLRSIDAFEEIGSGELGDTAWKLKVALWNNSAHALLACSEENELARDMAQRVLTIEPRNIKALFRRGCALSNLESWQMARRDFETVLRLEPANEAARGELQRVEEFCLAALDGKPKPSRGQDGFQPPARQQPAEDQDAPEDAALGEDPAEVVKVAQKEVERFRKEVLAAADSKGSVSKWCQRFNRVQTEIVELAQHQLTDPEMLADLRELWGPVFKRMSDKQKEDFLTAQDFIEEIRDRYGAEVEALVARPPQAGVQEAAAEA